MSQAHDELEHCGRRGGARGQDDDQGTDVGLRLYPAVDRFLPHQSGIAVQASPAAHRCDGRRDASPYERSRASGFTFFDFLANTVQLDADQRRRARMDPEMASVIEYADRTGESAVNNVIRERGY